MVLHDLLDLEKGVDAIKHLSSKARNRILLQCEGYGGFQFEKFGRTLEISTMFEGASGIFLRAIPNPTQKDGKYEDLKTKKVAGLYRGKLTFGAAKELKERKILGWISNGTNAPLNYTRVKNKSFLDHLTPGAGNVSKLILYMNWYFGGMTSWYSGVPNDTSGSLMRQEATEQDVVSYADAIKIDSHFSIGNIVACSKLPSDGSIDNLLHHTLAYRMGDIAVYQRKRTAGLAVIGGFAPEDCQFDMVDSLVGEQDVLEEVVNGAYPWTR